MGPLPAESKFRNKGDGKGSNEGKGSGREDRTGAQAIGCKKVTADGKAICFRFNNPKEGCKKTNCKFAHVCGRCFKAGVPMHKCDHQV